MFFHMMWEIGKNTLTTFLVLSNLRKQQLLLCYLENFINISYVPLDFINIWSYHVLVVIQTNP
jgi:hypothetical protein